MSWQAWLGTCALVSVALGCNQEATQGTSYAVLVHAVDDQAKALPGVQLSASGKVLGTTDASGQLALSLPGVEGQRVDLVASCPTNYKGPRERPAFLLKRAHNAQGDLSAEPIAVSLTCDATEHVALVAVQTGQAGLPILVRGQVVAQTSEAGTAHVMLRDPVGSSFQVTLDTSARRELRPENPTRTFTVTHQDAFSVWEQSFALEKRAPTSASRKRAKRRGGASAATSKHKSERSR